MVHPKHPRCPHCGKALYKTIKKGGLTNKSDSWGWCRNVDCSHYLVDQAKKKSKKSVPVGVKKPIKKKKITEGVIVKKVREEIKKKLNSEVVIHYVLLIAVVAQEVGYSEFASELIKKYGLDEMFRIGRPHKEENS